jgi:uncharacterized protein (DUF983 family)
MANNDRCGGHGAPKSLESYNCKCPSCGKVMEFFSDEMEREQNCRGCGKKLDFKQCEIEASA